VRLPILLLTGLAMALPLPAAALGLREALARTWQTNPRLAVVRESVRILGEEVEVARALGRPSLGASGGVNQSVDGLARFDDGGRNLNLGVTGSLPLYRGGLITASVRAAREREDAGRFDLATAENAVFLEAVRAYEDVRRDEAVVELNRGNVRVLEEQLRASRDRFEVGDLTRTDVAQSQARLARARSQLRAAEAQLVASREAFVRIVGVPPVDLEPPPPLGDLPATREAAVAAALEANPDLLAARAGERAASEDIDVARAARRPSVSASANAGYTNFLGSRDAALGLPAGTLDNDVSSAGVGVSVAVPLFQGGAPSSRLRQAQIRRSQAMLDIANTERLVAEQARTALENLEAARAVIVSAEEQVAASALALEGVRAENSVGLRTVLDVLDAEQELLNARVDLVRARRDEYVAGFALLAALGRATARDLALAVGEPEPPVMGPPAPRGTPRG
jgi:outer membrane protein